MDVEFSFDAEENLEVEEQDEQDSPEDPEDPEDPQEHPEDAEDVEDPEEPDDVEQDDVDQEEDELEDEDKDDKDDKDDQDDKDDKDDVDYDATVTRRTREMFDMDSKDDSSITCSFRQVPTPAFESRISFPIITKFEECRLIALRAQQLAHGAPPMVAVPKEWVPETVAEQEFAQRCMPLTLRRTLPNGIVEEWSLSELQSFQQDLMLLP